MREVDWNVEERRVRASTETRVHGEDLNDCLAQAHKHFDKFFGSREKYEIDEFKAEVTHQTIGGEAIIWLATVSASEVWG